MMSSTIRRKALSLCSSALANTAQHSLAGSAARGYVAGSPMLEAFVRGTTSVPEIHQGSHVYSKSLRDVSSLKTDFSTQKWIRSFATYSESAAREPIAQLQNNEGNIAETAKKTHNGPAYFTASGAVIGSVLSAPIVNAPPAAKLGMGSIVTSSFVPSLALFWHINNGMEEILADYVHHEMTRSLVLVMMRLFLIVAAKDVFVATN
ncbi:2-oxoacid dehydrogenase acyltransferase, catalytic domain-containing protein [Artemisia annua]|uniref:2-oxoacid dehydrogenase acyltransferase, catalytic domain-containing protein n=1 Tax=Artemisia annua TaxID=35608 RepID=A0A2U1L433_ARTAN|nr:2-oxoacid dehydrogenase acyltransferase, catalytic domain-containing protein [Artemisia annua]